VSVLEPRQRRLRTEALAIDRITADEHLLDRVRSKVPSVVAVRVTAGDPEDALSEEFDQFVTDLALVPPIDELLRQSLDEPEPTIGCLQQDGAAVGAAIGLIEGGDEGLPKEIWKQDRLSCGIVRQATASAWLNLLVAQQLYHNEAFRFSTFANYPG